MIPKEANEIKSMIEGHDKVRVIKYKARTEENKTKGTLHNSISSTNCVH